jgi:hypothetical protein
LGQFLGKKKYRFVMYDRGKRDCYYCTRKVSYRS